MTRALASTLMLAALAMPLEARAVVAPDSVVVLANADVPGSVALAIAYAEARDVPSAQVCVLSMPVTEDVTLDEYEARILGPLRDCLGSIEPRIAAVVVMRGVPLRVRIPADGGHFVSITAALSVWRSTLLDGTPLLGTPPGTTSDCGGTPCYAARVRSPFSFEPFEAGGSVTIAGIEHRPVFATMLHGRSDADAQGLIDVALEAEAIGGASGEFLLMRGADSARGALDVGYPTVVSELLARGITDVTTLDFDADLTGRGPLAAFVTGTASIGTSIEGSSFAPGALTDNLTSFGAVPENFRATGESQVSIARFVAAGAAGTHGTVDEPLNNCFPSRLFLADYVGGATLGQAYFGNLPYAYWLNLVVGDPMLAPYAERPTVTLEGVSDGGTLDGARTITVTATAPTGRAITSLILYVDGVEIARTDGGPMTHCLVPTGAAMEILAVARTAYDVAVMRPYPAAGWAAANVTSTGGVSLCGDAGPGPGDPPLARDAGSDAGVPLAPSQTCGCRTFSQTASPLAALCGLAIAMALRARRRGVLGAWTDRGR